jgi:tungstate transport system permease protein
VSYFGDGLSEAWHLIVTGDPYLRTLIGNSLKVAAIPAAVAAVVGVPAGVALGVGRFRGRGVLRALANAGLGLPPVVVGLVLILLFLPLSPLGGLHLAFTMKGVYVGQTVLDLPVVIALTSAATAAVPRPLLDQARAFGARRHRVAALAAREAKVGIVAALVAALGSGLSEVGIVVLIGGNIENVDQTLASAALEKADAADFATGLAIAIVLIGLTVVVLGLVTLLQYRSGRLLAVRQPS